MRLFSQILDFTIPRRFGFFGFDAGLCPSEAAEALCVIHGI